MLNLYPCSNYYAYRALLIMYSREIRLPELVARFSVLRVSPVLRINPKFQTRQIHYNDKLVALGREDRKRSLDVRTMNFIDGNTSYLEEDQTIRRKITVRYAGRDDRNELNSLRKAPLSVLFCRAH